MSLAEVPVDKPFELPTVTTQSAGEALELLLARAGARLPARDAVDARVVNDVRDRTGQLINSQAEVGGWPVLKSAPPPPDAARDGMPDAWEAEQGLDPSDAADGRVRAGDGSGYAHLEVHLNELARPAM